MQLDQVAAVIRPRRPWEAVDLGFAMARAWWRPLLAGWVVGVLPLWLLVLLLLGNRPGWCALALWWLRPLYSLAPLHVLSRKLFGATPGWRDTLNQTVRQGLRLAPRLLLWRRPDPQRSLLLPVFTLEGSTGAQRRARLRLFARQLPEAWWLTVASAAIEGCLVIALFGLVGVLLPSGTVDWQGALDAFGEGAAPPWFTRMLFAFWLLAITIVEPCYTAAGFALYLNRRTLLEGWDVEVTLRRLARRLRQGRSGRLARAGRVAALLLAMALPGLAAAAPAPARTATAGGRPPAEVAREVLSHPDFGATRTVRVWRLRGRADERPPRATAEPPGPWVVLAGNVLEVVLLSALLAAAGWLAFVLYRRARPYAVASRPAGSQDERAPLPFAFGGKRGELPLDAVTAALAELEAGRPAAALSLLYRGALGALAARRRLPVEPSWTEEQCLARLPADLPPRATAYLRELTGAWQAAAYAHREPAADEVRALCQRWRGDLAGLGGTT